MALPRARVLRIVRALDPSAPVPGDDVRPLSPFVRAEGGAPALEQTHVRVAHDGDALLVRFDCDDRDPWGTFDRRDDPVWQEEAVELFLAPGEGDPVEYLEFEVSPRGVLFDARVRNPASRREEMTVDVSWDCPGIAWRARVRPDGGAWRAELSIPWAAVAPPGPVPRTWRANFLRIERPRGAAPEFSCWSPTLTDPADFHKPACFGVLEIDP